MIKAEIVAHSLSPQGDELISVLCTFPRIILAEVNTHRMLSKNTSSSRAIPFKKMVEAVQENPFIPIAWQKEHTGMQGFEYFTKKVNVETTDLGDLKLAWLEARDYAIKQSTWLNKVGVTKQLCNRLLEPFMWTTMLITGSREGWDNFFNLRAGNYGFTIDGNYHQFKSKKELLGSRFGYLYKDNTDLDWLQNNEGHAEIHMMALAEEIYDVMNESSPNKLSPNEWHIPMISDLESIKLSTDNQIKFSVGRAANTSYTVVGDGKELTLEHAIKIHDKCVELVHSSVFEHCARAMSDEEYECFLKGERKINKNANHWSDVEYFYDYDKIFGWCNNLKGFIPYRYFIDNKIEL